jgi:hypothetical protein
MATTGAKLGVKVVPHDDGLALLFDPELLKQFGIDENTPLSVTTDGKTLQITPAATFPTADQVNAALIDVNKKWGVVLRKLAE